MSAALRQKVAHPSVPATAAANAVTGSVMKAISREMWAAGFDDGFEAGEDRELRRMLWLAVLRRIDRKRDPLKAVVSMAVARAPEPPTRASALVASGLLDMAAGADALARTLARSVANELQGFVSEAAVCSAIRRGLVDVLNAQAAGEGADDAR
jgi:hypothetical protein